MFCSCDNQFVEKGDSFIKHVDPFIGTSGHGHTYPGAAVPFGMLQISPDNGISGWDWSSGYHYSDSITIGFSHLHLSGTGIGDLGDIRFMPVNKKFNLVNTVKTRDDISYKSTYSHDEESADAGYYSVFLENHQIKAELTSSLRTAFHRYTFTKNDMQSVIVDLGYAFNWDNTELSQLKKVDKFTISGFRYSKGWAKNQKVFFVAKFSKSIKEFDLVSDEKYINENHVTGIKTSAQLYFNDLNEEKLEVKLGLSSVSVKNASTKNIYIQSATLNGEELNRTFITHNELMNEGILHFVMGENPNKSWDI